MRGGGQSRKHSTTPRAGPIGNGAQPVSTRLVGAHQVEASSGARATYASRTAPAQNPQTLFIGRPPSQTHVAGEPAII